MRYALLARPRADAARRLSEVGSPGPAVAYSRSVPLSPEQQRSIADLVAQVDVDNVLQAAAVLRRQADEMEGILTTATRDLQFNPCGGDPVSRDAQQLFQAKIDNITAVHWAHQAEVRAAADALRASARAYGYSEDEIEDMFVRLART